MKIWVVQTGERLPLSAGTRMMRSGLLAEELAERGHDVTWWASAFDHYARKWVDCEGATRELRKDLLLKLLRGIGYSRNVSVRRFVDHAVVARRFLKQAETEDRPDVIVAALPDYRIAYAAFRFARNHEIPFVLDLRDRWPWDFEELVPAWAVPLLRLALISDYRMAQTLITNADVLITMMESWNDWIKNVGGRFAHPRDAVFYLGAEAPKPQPLDIRTPTRAALSRCDGRWPILFIGSFTNRSWPQIAIEVEARLRQKRGPSPLFILAGDGDFMPELQRLTAGNPDIILPGYVNDAEIAALLEVAKVGLVTGNGDFEAMPNKVFTYLSGGVPILSSLSGELDAFLADEGVGLTCRDADALANAIDSLWKDESSRVAMSSRARNMFYDRYEAKRLYGHYADLVEQIAAGRAGLS